MKIPVYAAIGFLFASLHARGDLVIVQKLDSSEMVAKVTMKIKDGKVSTDIIPEANPDAGVTSIIDLTSGDSIVINHRSKQFIKRSAARYFANKEAAVADLSKTTKLTDTGKNEKMDGYGAEIYMVETPDRKAEYWFTKDYPDGAAVNEQMKKVWVMQATYYHSPDLSKLDGVMLKSAITMKSGTSAGSDAKITLISAKVQPVDDSEFQVPAGYTEAMPPPVKPPASTVWTAPIPAEIIPNARYEDLKRDFAITFTGPGTVLIEEDGVKYIGTFKPPGPKETDGIIMFAYDNPPPHAGIIMLKMVGKGMLYGNWSAMLAVPAAKEKAKALWPDLVHQDQADDIGMACVMYADSHDGHYPKQLADLLADHLILGADEQIRLAPAKVILDYDYLGAKLTDKDDKSKVLMRSKYTTSDGKRIVVTLDGNAKIEGDK